MTTTTETKRQVWVGCLACYNDGRLMGAWFDASDVGELTSDELHKANDPHRHDLKDQREGYGQHEEIWCFDIEGFGPWDHEMSPYEAFRKDAAITKVCERTGAPAAAVLAYAGYAGVEADELADGDGFEDHYHGTWDSFTEYVEDFHRSCYREDELGPFADYIAWDRMAQSWLNGGEWRAVDTGEGTVFVFSCG